MSEKSSNQYYVEMFGNFKLTDGERSVDQEDLRSDMIIKLFSYIYCHRKKEITIQELVDALWDEDHSANPAGALKNLVYRMRSILKKEWPEDEFIITGRGSYKWNDHIPISSDMEELESNYQKASKEENIVLRTQFYLTAIERYKGSFLPTIGSEHWVTPWTAYYHSMYISSVRLAANLLEEQEQYEQMEQICTYALSMDPLSEDLYCCLIRSLIKQNKIKQAEAQYKKAIDVLYENLGVSPSNELKDLYQDCLKMTHIEERNLSVIQAQLLEEHQGGPFLCEYGLFSRIYRLEKNRSDRFGISVYLILITVELTFNVDPSSQMYLNMINDGMEKVEYALLNNLRSGDVISRYSASQYICLLPSCQYETALKVQRRIEKGFDAQHKKRARTKISFSLDELYGNTND